MFPKIGRIWISIYRIRLLFWLFLEQRVQSQLESVIQHARDQLLQKRTRTLNAGVLVDLDQPYLVLCVYDEIESEQLEAMLSLVRVNFSLD